MKKTLTLKKKKVEPTFCDELQVGQSIKLSGLELQVIAIEDTTVVLNRRGMPVLWEKSWLNNYPDKSK